MLRKAIIAITLLIVASLLSINVVSASDKKEIKKTIYVLGDDGKIGTFDIAKGRYVVVADVSYIKFRQPFHPQVLAICRNNLAYVFGYNDDYDRGLMEVNLKNKKRRMLTAADYGYIEMMTCDRRGMLISIYDGASRFTLINTKRNGELVHLPEFGEDFYQGAITLDKKHVVISNMYDVYFIDRAKNKVTSSISIYPNGYFGGFVRVGSYYYAFTDQNVQRIDSRTFSATTIWDFEGSHTVPDFIDAAVAP